MKCAKCGCEVGNRPVCPYCGGTVYIQGAAWNGENHGGPTTMRAGEFHGSGRSGPDVRELERRLKSLETKLSLTIILLCGVFALEILTLVIAALK